jgi:hypothetical protein
MGQIRAMPSNARVARRATPWVAVGFNLRKRARLNRSAQEGPPGALEHGSFVESYAGLRQQFPILLPKRHPTVVFFLPLDVFDQAVNVAVRTSKGPVSLLPVREALKYIILLDPACRTGFDVFNKIGQTYCGMHAREDVQMIIHATNAVDVSLPVSDDSPDITEQVGAAFPVEDRGAIPRRKNDVIGDGGEGRHERIVPRSTRCGVDVDIAFFP